MGRYTTANRYPTPAAAKDGTQLNKLQNLPYKRKLLSILQPGQGGLERGITRLIPAHIYLAVVTSEHNFSTLNGVQKQGALPFQHG